MTGALCRSLQLGRSDVYMKGIAPPNTAFKGCRGGDGRAPFTLVPLDLPRGRRYPVDFAVRSSLTFAVPSGSVLDAAAVPAGVSRRQAVRSSTEVVLLRCPFRMLPIPELLHDTPQVSVLLRDLNRLALCVGCR